MGKSVRAYYTLSVSAFDARGNTLQQVVAVEGLAAGDASSGSKRGRLVQHEGRRAGFGGERLRMYRVRIQDGPQQMERN